MKITTLIENELALDHRDLEAEFGLSLLIEHADRRILFDTGAAGAAMRNASHLGIDLRQVDAVVLSHHHFDHGGGLPAFFAINDHAKVYLRHPPAGKEILPRPPGGQPLHRLAGGAPRTLQGSLRLCRHLHGVSACGVQS